MQFKEFVEITRPVIGGRGGVHKYVKTLFDAILSDNGKDILDDYGESTFKSYANGKTSISEISKAMIPYLDLVEFSSFIFETEESVQIELCKCLKKYCPGINITNVGEEIADLFSSIIREAATKKRKSPTPKENVGIADAVKLPEEQINNDSPYSEEDTILLQEFNSDYDEIMMQLIGEGYANYLIDMSMPTQIQFLFESKWSTKAEGFINLTLKSYIYALLGELNELKDSLIANNSAPFFIRKTRERVRNLYVKLHPESFADSLYQEAFIDDWDEGEYY